MKILKNAQYNSLMDQLKELEKRLKKTSEDYEIRNCQNYVLRKENEELKETNLALQKIIISQTEEIESIREVSYEEQKKPKKIK